MIGLITNNFSGLGYIVSSSVSSLLGGWQWGVRVTPVLGAICILVFILVMKEPQRGESEKAAGAANVVNIPETSYWEDIKAICTMYSPLIFCLENRDQNLKSILTFLVCRLRHAQDGRKNLRMIWSSLVLSLQKPSSNLCKWPNQILIISEMALSNINK